MATKIGNSYRDKSTGVIGTAVAQITDPDGIALPDGTMIPITLTQLDLAPEFLNDVPNMRWYDDRKLEDAPA